MLDASRQMVSTHLHREKKNLYMWMTERSRKELLITHSLGMMRAILCNWQCGLIVEGLYSTINLLFLSCYFFFIISYLHLIAYFFLYLFACARTHAHITQTSLNVVQWLDMLMPNFFFLFFILCLEEKISWKTFAAIYC